MMNSPYGLQVVDNCEKCPLRKPDHFCCLAPEALREFNACSHSSSFPQHSVLTTEGQPARGVFIVCQGRIKLSSMSKDGKSVILRIARAGEAIGLSAVISNRPYESSAETLVPTQVRFIGAPDIMRIVRTYPEAAIHLAQSLSRECVSAYNEIRSLALAPSCASRLATLLLSWCTPANAKNGEFRISAEFTQGEIAEMIGTSRETVTRLFTQFKNKRLIESRGPGFCIRDVRALEAIAI